MHEKFLRELKYKKIDEYDEKTNAQIKRFLGMVDLVLTVPYVKLFSRRITVSVEGTEEKLWETHIVFASVVLLDARDEKSQDMYLDHFFVPFRPFRIRSIMEKNELEQLLAELWKDFEAIDEHFGVPDMLDNKTGEA